ncbi:MAG: DNA mismatch repair endonuclease MutL [Lentisphaeria bacterium]|nr:DNA mismatch repair endonuclease MutL [Lentisphaeria bacterium]
MSKIFVMPEQLSNRIAAGEVIERPASVVKELVENAIDAGATRITVRVEQAGSRLIQVSDNGCGMDAEDALLCLEQHGTSKLKSEEDMTRIMTLGFRGEAIPSIASISRMTIETRQPSSVEGIKVTVEGGHRKEAAPAGCPPGTTFTIRDLFFNVPARKKFLKSAPTEQQHIEETILLLALPHPEISFELISDGRISVQSPGDTSINARLRAFFGRNFASQMLPVEHREEGMIIHGFIGAPGFARPTRREQRLFVNDRAVDSPALYRGVRDGYGALAEHGKYPPCILFIQIDPEEVDVNVHPAKREIRFRREYVVSRAVSTAVAAALHGPEARPQSVLDPRIPIEPLLAGAGVTYTPHPETPDLFLPEAPPLEQMPKENPPAREKTELTDIPGLSLPGLDRPPVSAGLEQTAPITEKTAEELEPLKPIKPVPVFQGDWPTEVLGILDATYILAKSAAGLVLIDQHAAHERIMFEKLLRESDQGGMKQPLLLPVTLDLPKPAAAMLLRTRAWFEKLGFDIEDMGGNTVMLNAIPTTLGTGNLENLLLDTLSELAEEAAARIPLEREHVARAACRAAIKAGDVLTIPMAEKLLEDLAACQRGMLCPHGRPTMITFTIQELARRFGRK